MKRIIVEGWKKIYSLSTKLMTAYVGPTLSRILNVFRLSWLLKAMIAKTWNDPKDFLLLWSSYKIGKLVKVGKKTWNIIAKKIHMRWKLRYKWKKVRCSTKLLFAVWVTTNMSINKYQRREVPCRKEKHIHDMILKPLSSINK